VPDWKKIYRGKLQFHCIKYFWLSIYYKFLNCQIAVLFEMKSIMTQVVGPDEINTLVIVGAMMVE